MINYLKQYADKTYEELVNSLIWFDLSLKLKAIFAKIPTTFKTINDESIVGEGNIEITGGGTPQNLQSVIDVGGYAEYDGGNSFVSLLTGTNDNKYIGLYVSNTLNTKESGVSYSNDEIQMSSRDDVANTYFSIDMTGNDFVLGYEKNPFATRLRFNETPTQVTNIIIPSKIIAGDYTINTTPNTTYTVSTLPTGVLNDRAIVSDATAPTYLGALVGGGAVMTPVWYNGTSWVSR